MSSDKILATIDRFEFIAEWLITSKYPNNVEIFHQFLVLIEAVKFYYKMKKFVHMDVFIEDNAFEEHKKPPKFVLPSQVKATRGEMQRLLQQVKTKSYEAYQHNVGAYESTSTGKKISLRSNLPIPPQFSLSRITNLETLGQVLYLLRPLVYIVALWVYGPKSYKSWVISFIIDLVRIILQRNIKVRNVGEKMELENRNKQMILKMMFRNPFYDNILKPKILLPILSKLFKTDGWIMKIIMYLLEMKSSVTLTI